jgi:hypothetical protein
MIGVFPRLFVGLVEPDFCPALAGLVSQIQNIMFLTVHFFILFVTIDHATWACRRAGSPVSVSLEVTEHLVEEKQYSQHTSRRKRSVKLYLMGKCQKAYNLILGLQKYEFFLSSIVH